MKSPSCGLAPFPSRIALGAARAAVVGIAVASVCASAPSVASSSSAYALVVRYPVEGQQIGAFAATFAIGSAPPGSVVTVNGVRASIAPDGGWSAFFPLKPGAFVMHVRASEGVWRADVDRIVDVADGSVSPFPARTTIVQPGDPLHLAVSAPDGSVVTADGPGFTGVALASDQSAGTGAFTATIAASAWAAGPSHVVYRIADANESRTVTSSGPLTIASRPVLFVGDVIPYSPDPESGDRPYAMLAPAPYADTDVVEPVGTQLAVTGRFGEYLRVALPGYAPHYVDRLSLAPEGTGSSLAVAVVSSVSASHDARDTTLVIRLSGARPAVRVVEGPRTTGKVWIYGVRSAGASEARAFAVPFELPQRAFWGYTEAWSGDDLVVRFKRPPDFAPAPKPALTGLRIVIDPGHSPDTGAVGPLGTLERDVNLDIASRLASRLRALGAIVMMTRSGDENVLLYDRPALAERFGADVLISVHNNAPPDGTDPAASHGYSIYYFQQHSLALAQAIHDAYRREIDIPDAGLHSGDLALVRPSAMPAVLTESAYITWPWEEMRLRDPAFRSRLAEAMADGIERWAAAMRAIESEG